MSIWDTHVSHSIPMSIGTHMFVTQFPCLLGHTCASLSSHVYWDKHVHHSIPKSIGTLCILYFLWEDPFLLHPDSLVAWSEPIQGFTGRTAIDIYSYRNRLLSFKWTQHVLCTRYKLALIDVFLKIRKKNQNVQHDSSYLAYFKKRKSLDFVFKYLLFYWRWKSSKTCKQLKILLKKWRTIVRCKQSFIIILN